MTHLFLQYNAYIVIIKDEEVTIWFNSILIVPSKQVETGRSHILMSKTSQTVVTAGI